MTPKSAIKANTVHKTEPMRRHNKKISKPVFIFPPCSLVFTVIVEVVLYIVFNALTEPVRVRDLVVVGVGDGVNDGVRESVLVAVKVADFVSDCVRVVVGVLVFGDDVDGVLVFDGEAEVELVVV